MKVTNRNLKGIQTKRNKFRLESMSNLTKSLIKKIKNNKYFNGFKDNFILKLVAS
jgi:hypothetical protein